MLDCAALPETAAEFLAEVVTDNGPPVPVEAEEGLVRLIVLGLLYPLLYVPRVSGWRDRAPDGQLTDRAGRA